MSDETKPTKSSKPIKDKVDELLKPLSKPDSRQPGTLFIRRDFLRIEAPRRLDRVGHRDS